MNYSHLARIHQLHEEVAGSSREVEANSDAESMADEYEDDDSDDECSHQYQAFDLPTRFLGTIIHRQIAAHGQRNSQQPPPLHININTTTPNARAGD